MNAPANPNSVSANSRPRDLPASSGGVEDTPRENTPLTTEELPLTGMNSVWVLLITLPIAFLIIRKKFHHE